MMHQPVPSREAKPDFLQKTYPLFVIGLNRLDLANWIVADNQLDYYLNEKQRIGTTHPDQVFMAEADSGQAQSEVLDLLIDHLPNQFPHIYSRQNDVFTAGNHLVALNCDEEPLAIAAKLVAEDLVIMRKGENGWRLTAASLHFPSSWSLKEKFSKPLYQIHAPVPGFGTGTKNAAMIARIFDHLRVDQPVWRVNWSIYGDDQLFHPPVHFRGEHDANGSAKPERDFFRVEYQTLRKLPINGDILFTIRIFIDPLDELKKTFDGERLAGELIASLERLDSEQLAYKGLTFKGLPKKRDRLIKNLREIGAKAG